jgi:hypothetical protein
MAQVLLMDGTVINAQGSRTCDEAWQRAKKLASTYREAVVLRDDDGDWLVSPDGDREKMRVADWIALGFAVPEEEHAQPMFARRVHTNRVRVLHDDGTVVTRIDSATNIYPQGSPLSAAYEHPNGITITDEEARKLGLEIEE